MDILPRIYNIIRLTLTAVRDKWECDSNSSYRSFAVFGYDFMLTKKESNSNLNHIDDIDVWLIEINSSPAVAEKLLPIFAEKLVKYAIDSIYPEDVDINEDENKTEEIKKEKNENRLQLFKEDFITISM